MRVWSHLDSNKPADAIDISRRSKWGNPFRMESEADREKVVDQFRKWVWTQPQLIAEARQELRGKDLACWCAPKACHGDIWIEIVNTPEFPESLW